MKKGPLTKFWFVAVIVVIIVAGMLIYFNSSYEDIDLSAVDYYDCENSIYYVTSRHINDLPVTYYNIDDKLLTTCYYAPPNEEARLECNNIVDLAGICNLRSLDK